MSLVNKHTKNLAELQELANEWIRELKPCADCATVVGLSGELGSGKTSFVQGVAKALGVKEHVTSPTFVLMKKYSIPSSGLLATNYKLLTHMDAYRLNSGKDLGPLRIDELLKNADNLVMIEWPERVRSALPVEMIDISFAVEGEGRRINF